MIVYVIMSNEKPQFVPLSTLDNTFPDLMAKAIELVQDYLKCGYEEQEIIDSITPIIRAAIGDAAVQEREKQFRQKIYRIMEKPELKIVK